MNQIADLMAARYTYADIAAEQNPEQVVYPENAVIELLQLLGYVTLDQIERINPNQLKTQLHEKRYPKNEVA